MAGKDYYRLKRPALAAWREARAEQQQIIAVHVEKLGNLWLHVDLLPLLSVRWPESHCNAQRGTFAFDPVVWDRKRAEQLFDFSYRLECWQISAPKRQYGYFVLPLLHRKAISWANGCNARQTGIP